MRLSCNVDTFKSGALPRRKPVRLTIAVMTAVLSVMSSCVLSAQVKPDVVYRYRKVIKYDTVVVKDTVFVRKKQHIQPVPKNNMMIAVAFPATLSRTRIIHNENKINYSLNSDDGNMKKVRFNYLALLAAIQTAAGVSGYAQDSEALKYFPGQASFFYPAGTSGQNSVDYRYGFSLNVLWGKVGAVKGVEAGGMFNRAAADVAGLQAAGMGNRAGNVKGVQAGGLFNIAHNAAGLQAGGVFNVARNTSGMQTAGVFNAADTVALQTGGIANLAQKARAIQVAGVVNLTGEHCGFQAAGIANINQSASGAGFAGILNRTKTMKNGFRLSLISVVDTVEAGIPVAFVNIVKKGFYDEFAVSFADYANVSLSYKAGLRRFYTVYSAGCNFGKDRLWVFGAGFGSRITVSDKFDFQPEILVYTYFPDNFKNISQTMATHIKPGFVYKLGSRYGISIAPSLYILNSDRRSDADYYRVSPVGAVYEHEKDNRKISVGAGVGIGFSIN